MLYELYDMGFIMRWKHHLPNESCYVAGLNATSVTSGFTQSVFSDAKDSVRMRSMLELSEWYYIRSYIVFAL